MSDRCVNVLLSGVVGSDASALTRTCPICTVVLRYRHRESWKRAEALAVKCRKCARRATVDLSATAKRCTACRQTKPIDQFVVSAKRLSGVMERCKDCERARFAALRADLARRVDELKNGHPCADCGGLFPPVCLDFDHLPQFQKSMGVAQMVGRCRIWAAIVAEIAKCELVCANCHRIRTVGRRRAG